MPTTRSDWQHLDLYRVLGVPASATGAEITAAYRGLVRCLHPDTNPSDTRAEERFLEATLAYEVLGRLETRSEYDDLSRRAASRPRGDSRTAASSRNSRESRPRPADPRNRVPGPAKSPFTKRGDDLAVTVAVSYPDLVLGGEVDVPSPSGGTVLVRVPPGTPSGRTFRVKGLGAAGPGLPGDLLVTTEVIIPRELSSAQYRALRAMARATPPRSSELNRDRRSRFARRALRTERG